LFSFIAIFFLFEVVTRKRSLLGERFDQRRDIRNLARLARVEDVQLLMRSVIVAAELRIDADSGFFVLDNHSRAIFHSELVVDAPTPLRLRALVGAEKGHVQSLIKPPLTKTPGEFGDFRVLGAGHGVQRPHDDNVIEREVVFERRAVLREEARKRMILGRLEE